ncbi:MAG: 4-hydroxy-tetrahydrodipicolinate reductase [Gemmatimonadales bacterium]|nr:4-hydroxy-tetrahydrodipicolinate reductase [Gemmatimonadales bacterium]
MIQVAVHGAEGRMGLLLAELVASAQDCNLCGLITEDGQEQTPGAFHPTLPLTEQSQMADSLPDGCVIIDFSLAPALNGLLDQAKKLHAALVVGTTGFNEAQEELLAGFARKQAVVRAPNFSIGIPALQMLLQLLAKTLPSGFDPEQVETHHVTKLDRPSGTAARLGAAYQEIRGGNPVPTHSLRQGGIIGEHTWKFSDQEETLVITHRAHSRKAFLRGVLPAVRFVAGREPGLYDLGDVLENMGGQQVDPAG